MNNYVKQRICQDERGFTLVEMLVTIMIMLVVMFALYNIFDMSVRVFSFGNDKVEATENARIGMEKMERELRAAYPYNKPAGTSSDYRFWDPTIPSNPVVPPANSQQITFGNDLNGDRVIEPATEQITYRLSATGPPYTLQRINNGTTSPLIENVGKFDNGTPGDPSDDIPGLRFTPLTSSGGTPTTNSQIARVKIELLTNKNGRTQTLTTEVALRNPGG